MGKVKRGGLYRKRGTEIVPLKKASFVHKPDPLLRLAEKVGNEKVYNTAFGMKALGNGKARVRYAPSAPLSGAVKKGE